MLQSKHLQEIRQRQLNDTKSYSLLTLLMMELLSSKFVITWQPKQGRDPPQESCRLSNS